MAPMVTCDNTGQRHQQSPQLQNNRRPRHGTLNKLGFKCHPYTGSNSGHPDCYDPVGSVSLRLQHGLRLSSRPQTSTIHCIGTYWTDQFSYYPGPHLGLGLAYPNISHIYNLLEQGNMKGQVALEW